MTRGDAARVARGEHDAGRFDGDVGAGADGQADVGAGEGGGVVDAVADHGDALAALLQVGDGLVLVLGEDLGEDLVDAEVAADGVGDLPGVAGDHRHVDAHPAEVVDGLSGLGADLVLERERADDRRRRGAGTARRRHAPPSRDRIAAARRGHRAPRWRSSAGPPTA